MLKEPVFHFISIAFVLLCCIIRLWCAVGSELTNVMCLCFVYCEIWAGECWQQTLSQSKWPSQQQFQYSFCLIAGKKKMLMCQCCALLTTDTALECLLGVIWKNSDLCPESRCYYFPCPWIIANFSCVSCYQMANAHDLVWSSKKMSWMCLQYAISMQFRWDIELKEQPEWDWNRF